MTNPLHCSDPQASRRWTYGQKMFEDGDWEAARDLFAQTLEIEPGFVPAWLHIGRALEKLSDPKGAESAYREALRLDPDDRMAAGARLARLLDEPAPALSPAYVARLFDEYAHRFDRHLLEDLHYSGPELIDEALNEVEPTRMFDRALDLGCGTGLAGPFLRRRARKLVGVDLSAKMVEAARAKAIYDELAVADVTAFLAGASPGSFGCVAAADVFVYLGDLAPVLRAAFAALAGGGWLVFTVETRHLGDGFALGDTMRFNHAESYIEATSRAAGFEIASIKRRSSRIERGAPVWGMLVTLAKPAA